MEQFNLSKWLKDKSRKVVTRDGRPVRIICTDRKPRSGNIVGLVGEDESLIYVWNNDGKHIVSEILDNDLFFADDENLNSIIDELKSYLKKTPKEQVEKDWKEIQDWYTKHFTNENHNEEEELSEFEEQFASILFDREYEGKTNTEDDIEKGMLSYRLAAKEYSPELLDLARKKILKDLPKWTKWKKDCLHNLTSVIDGRLYYNGYYIDINELEKLPKEE